MPYFCVMETTIKISSRELTTSWLNKVKALFEGVEELEIVIRPVHGSFSTVNEKQETYVARINNAIQNLETGKDTITLSKDEYEELVLKLKS